VFAVALTNELLQSFIEWANQQTISTMKTRKADFHYRTLFDF